MDNSLDRALSNIPSFFFKAFAFKPFYKQLKLLWELTSWLIIWFFSTMLRWFASSSDLFRTRAINIKNVLSSLFHFFLSILVSLPQAKNTKCFDVYV